MKNYLVSAAAALLLGTGAASAHHSFALYDISKTSAIQGTVDQFEWTNPHCWLFVNVPGPGTSVRSYGFELRSVGEILRMGWKKHSVRPGDMIKVSFHPTRDGSTAGQLLQAWAADGILIGKPPS